MSLDTSHPEMAGAQGLYPGMCQLTCVRVCQIFFDAKSWILLWFEHNDIWHFDIFKAPQGYHLTDLNLMCCTVFKCKISILSNPILLYWTLTNLLNHPTVTNSQHFNVIIRESNSLLIQFWKTSFSWTSKKDLFDLYFKGENDALSESNREYVWKSPHARTWRERIILSLKIGPTLWPLFWTEGNPSFSMCVVS